MTRHLVLLGGGHANIHVLKALAASRPSGVRTTLVSPYSSQLYSGMLSGLISGAYRADACSIPLDTLAQASGAVLRCTSAWSIDPAVRRIRLADGQDLDYDLLAIDIGSEIRHSLIESTPNRLTPVRPPQPFFEKFQAFCQEGIDAPLAVIGGGMGGIEIACAMRVATGYGAPVALLAGARGIVPTGPPGLRRRMRDALQRQGVDIIDEEAAYVTQTGIETASGRRLAAAFIVLATGPQPPGLFSRSNLRRDENGYLQVNETLQCVGEPAIFAAGDCAALPGSAVARSGVYAVRQGPVLAHNLRAALSGGALRRFRPQRRALYLIATGSEYAVGTWGNWSCGGRALWHWKRYIDRAFVRRFS